MPTQKELFDFYVSQGLQPHQAAAMVGHAQAESGLDPTVQERRADGSRGPGYGLFQWTTPERRAGLDTFARSGTGIELNPNDWKTQALYSLHELGTNEKAAGDRLFGAQTYGEAVDAGMHYLRPQGYTQSNPQGGLNYAGRFNGGAGLAGVAPTMPPSTMVAGGPQGGLLQQQPLTGIDAEIAGWSGPQYDTAGGRAALDKVMMADAAKKGAATSAAMAAGAKIGEGLMAAGAPKQQPWQNLQASVHAPQQQAQLPDFSQQLAQSRLRRKPWDMEDV